MYCCLDEGHIACQALWDLHNDMHGKQHEQGILVEERGQNMQIRWVFSYTVALTISETIPRHGIPTHTGIQQYIIYNYGVVFNRYGVDEHRIDEQVILPNTWLTKHQTPPGEGNTLAHEHRTLLKNDKKHLQSKLRFLISSDTWTVLNNKVCKYIIFLAGAKQPLWRYGTGEPSGWL